MMPLSDLIYLAATDKTFRAELAADPGTALRERGLQVSQRPRKRRERIQRLLLCSPQNLGVWLSSQIEEIGEDWGRI